MMLVLLLALSAPAPPAKATPSLRIEGTWLTVSGTALHHFHKGGAYTGWDIPDGTLRVGTWKRNGECVDIEWRDVPAPPGAPPWPWELAIPLESLRRIRPKPGPGA